jgi:hypothetical protein
MQRYNHSHDEAHREDKALEDVNEARVCGGDARGAACNDLGEQTSKGQENACNELDVCTESGMKGKGRMGTDRLEQQDIGTCAVFCNTRLEEVACSGCLVNTGHRGK